MEKVELNKDMKLSEHFTLGELTKTSCKTKDGNIPSRVAIENLKNLCENWLEDLRYSYNTLSHNRDSPHCEMLIINSGYRSPEVNKRVGGAPTSNHLTGTQRDYDELFIERNKAGSHWIHCAVKPKDNRRKSGFILAK